jgi:hypothetical protein
MLRVRDVGALFKDAGTQKKKKKYRSREDLVALALNKCLLVLKAE